jgi:hypothetical protein
VNRNGRKHGTSVKRAYIREYRQFKEYGGFGIRYAGSSVGEAITMNGNIGLQLELTTGQKMLISTRKPKELKIALLCYQALVKEGKCIPHEEVWTNARR